LGTSISPREHLDELRKADYQEFLKAGIGQALATWKKVFTTKAKKSTKKNEGRKGFVTMISPCKPGNKL
jgi:DNA invertase Pin-like site-specific DNA recombinase